MRRSLISIPASSQTMDSLAFLFLSLSLFLLSSFHTNSAAAAASLFPEGALPTRSGYLPIIPNTNTTANSLFFAFYEAQHPPSHLSSTPLLVWLQGGPGCSSLQANFFEIGPYLVSTHQPSLRPNPFTWNRLFGLLFIDTPLGCGFSPATSLPSIPRNQPTIARHLFAALNSFLSSSSDPSSFRARPLYLTGSSYAGKYIPSTGHYILRHNPKLPTSRQINLAGVAIGNGLTHPVSQVTTHAAIAYYTGLINDQQRAYLEELQTQVVGLIVRGNWSEATDARTGLMDWLQNAAGLATTLDLTKSKPYQSEMVGVFLNKEEVKEALGAKKGVFWEHCNETVRRALHEDEMKSVKFAVEELARKSRVLLYQGNNDLEDGTVSAEAWMKEMEWEGLGRFMKAERKVWMVDGKRVGYVQRWGSLSHAVVLGAGHLAGADQGRSTQGLIEDWVLEQGLFRDHHHPLPHPSAHKDTTGFSSSY